MSKFRRIVEKNLVKYNCNLVEDVYQDKKDLSLSKAIYKTIISRLKKSIGNYTEINLNSIIENITCFIFRSLEYDTFVVVFRYDENEKTLGSFTSDNNIIYINLAYHFWPFKYLIKKNDNNEVWLLSKIYVTLLEDEESIKSTFVHEFQHYLDYMRGKIKDNAFKSTDTDIDDKNYYNLAHERNAYAMENIYKIINKTIEANNSKVMSDLTPEQRLDFIKNKWTADKEFMKYYNELEPKAQKRLLSRIYQYFSTDFWKDNNK